MYIFNSPGDFDLWSQQGVYPAVHALKLLILGNTGGNLIQGVGQRPHSRQKHNEIADSDAALGNPISPDDQYGAGIQNGVCRA